jgi:hypothetical protein
MNVGGRGNIYMDGGGFGFGLKFRMETLVMVVD